jgi:serine/threonine protein phosphatase PrpC
MKTANKTDIGRIRMVNEDRAEVCNDLNGFTLAIVADGMGGHQAGDIASQIAIDTIREELRSIHSGLTVEAYEDAIERAVLRANEEVYDLASNNEQYHGMGTTVVAALVSEDVIIIAHIGDSRAYKLDGSTIVQLTEDHSLVNELVKTGQITAEEADNHPRRNVVTRALGTEQHVEVDIGHYTWSRNEQLLLCTDGLSSSVHLDRIKEIISTDESVEWKVNRLVESALESGGDDNITVVLLANEPANKEIKG